jgi:hypothetical protein
MFRSFIVALADPPMRKVVNMVGLSNFVKQKLPHEMVAGLPSSPPPSEF